MFLHTHTHIFNCLCIDALVDAQNNETAEKTTDTPADSLDDDSNVITITGSDDPKQVEEDATENETSADEPAETGAKDNSDTETAESSIVETVEKAPATKKKPLKKKDKEES